VKFLIVGKRLFESSVFRLIELISVTGLPLQYLLLIDEKSNDCCGESATFAPEHKLTIYVLIAICVSSFYISAIKKDKLLSPVLEVLINSTLLFAIIFNGVIAFQIGDLFWLIGNLPIGFIFTIQLIKNQRCFIEVYKETDVESANRFEKVGRQILLLHPIIKFPLLLILFLPIFTLITSLLLLFGQKPDSIVKAFTDTYKHGFSQLDYMCDNVQCGGHFLCSVAANGHKDIVKPVRYGERGGGKIICNRQLLIANAFEEIIEQKLPKFHKIIRGNYNKVGNLIHRYYGIFNNKYVADVVYIFMKPLELFFLITIYLIDQKPENRIAVQYLSKSDRNNIKGQL
jgi:hypothetical protein